MLPYLLDWANLLGRWVHVITGIAWIGASFYFIWLDNHLESPRQALSDIGVGGELWAVHGGGFYNAQKYRLAPPRLPATLHWFRWEAYSTLLSGLFLLCVLYYAQADVYLIDPAVADLSPAAAIAIGIAALAGGWIVYDLLCRSGLGRNDRALGLVLAALCAAAAYGLCHVFSGRAAYLHFGAMLGTVMVLNVFFVIIPGQRAMVRAAAEGRPPDPAHGLRGKQRSVHNTYFTLPVILAMISNHYAMLYGARQNWLALIAMSAAGALVRVHFVARHKGRAPRWIALAGVAVVIAMVFALRPSDEPATATTSAAEASRIVNARCVPCHAATPTFSGLNGPPKGLVLDNYASLVANAQRARGQVATRAMPLGNVTHMTEAERAVLIEWLGRKEVR